MMPAAKHFDPIMGVDIHIIQPPGPVPPIPIPHPFIGFFLDPADYVPVIGATVYVNGMPRVQAGSGSGIPSIVFHIPIGGTFIKPIGNEGEAFMGSSTVVVEGEPFSYLSLPVLSCSCIGMPAPVRKGKGAKGGFMMPMSIVTPIPAGLPVLVGGPPTISMTALAFKVGFKVAGTLLKVIAKVGKAAAKGLGKLAGKLRNAASKVLAKGKNAAANLRNKVSRLKCKITGHPVDVATGKVFTEHIDFELPGPVPFKWERVYYTTSIYNGPLGYGWHHCYDSTLIVDQNESVIAVRQNDGRSVGFPLLNIGESYYDRLEKLTLIRGTNDYVLKNEEGLLHRFSKVSPHNNEYKVIAVENQNGHKIRLNYQNDYLVQIIDSTGRNLVLINDERGRLREIIGPHPDEREKEIRIVSYEYDSHDNLVVMRDTLNQAFLYTYGGHLLLKETNRNGLSFYFEYDGKDENARCIHTWGDDGIYDHKLTYHIDEQLTIVENSVGHKSYNYYNDEGLVTEVINPLGDISTTVYNEFNEIIKEIDELGRCATYEYDERGNQTKIISTDGSNINMEYDKDNQLVSAKDAVGGKWQWKYDNNGNLIERTDCFGRVTKYNYRQGLLNFITDPAGYRIRLNYDKELNLSELITPDGGISHWMYDKLGRCREITDPKGNIQRRYFDLLGRVYQVDEPDSNVRIFKYDGESNVLRAKDKQHDVAFSYQGMNRLASRSEAGTIVRFHYDTEEQLTGITNEHGFVYRFELDSLGNVFKEIGFDQQTRIYYRDPAGQVIKVQRPEKRWTKYIYDLTGRVTQVSYHDETKEKYEYRSDGELIIAENQYLKVQFERDLIGQVTKEIQGDFEVNSGYDILGRRTKITSSLGADINITRNAMGDVEQMGAKQSENQSWNAIFKRDLMGLEIERSLPGGIISRTKRDKLGRPVHHIISGMKGDFMDKRYEWDVNDRLRKIIDAHHGTTTFSHDELGNLAGAQYGDGTFEFRMPDAVGNLFKTKDRKDRKYGPAGQLLEANGTSYTYDEEGNLIQKTETRGKTWNFEWNASRMLAKVIRPDGGEVTFTYDALGRRLSKTYRGKTTRWVWDGNVPLHEWIETELTQETEEYNPNYTVSKNKTEDLLNIAPANGPPLDLTTWIFEPESFAPVAKLLRQERFSIVSNYLGTPTQMYNSKGEQVWAADTSIYGELLNLKENREACPFRYPGQYEDTETGLYYNRFRYYDPESGVYISQDPMRMSGGLGLYSYVHDPNFWVDMFGLNCNPSGAKIKGYTQHGLNQAIGRNGGKGVNARAMLDAVKNPKKVVEQANGTTKYIGKKATVVLNEEGKVVTTWGKSRGPRIRPEGTSRLSGGGSAQRRANKEGFSYLPGAIR